MKFKNQDDNRYRVKFMVATEELMDKLTVKEFISYLEENAELEDKEHEYIDGKTVLCKVYDLKEADSNLHKEFLVTEDGRVFYWLSLLKKVELVDREERSKSESLRKWYRCIFDDEMLINEDFNIKVQPGQIVQIQREHTINNWPLIWVNNEDYDMAIEDDEFSTYFEEFDIGSFEKKMSRVEFKQIFECDEDCMESVFEDLLSGFYEDYFQIAVDRMLESALDARGHYISKGLNVESEVVYYMMLANKYQGKYTVSDWIKDTLKNYPQYLDDDFSDMVDAEEYIKVTRR